MNMQVSVSYGNQVEGLRIKERALENLMPDQSEEERVAAVLDFVTASIRTRAQRYLKDETDDLVERYVEQNTDPIS